MIYVKNFIYLLILAVLININVGCGENEYEQPTTSVITSITPEPPQPLIEQKPSKKQGSSDTIDRGEARVSERERRIKPIKSKIEYDQQQKRMIQEERIKSKNQRQKKIKKETEYTYYDAEAAEEKRLEDLKIDQIERQREEQERLFIEEERRHNIEIQKQQKENEKKCSEYFNYAKFNPKREYKEYNEDYFIDYYYVRNTICHKDEIMDCEKNRKLNRNRETTCQCREIFSSESMIRYRAEAKNEIEYNCHKLTEQKAYANRIVKRNNNYEVSEYVCDIKDNKYICRKEQEFEVKYFPNLDKCQELYRISYK